MCHAEDRTFSIGELVQASGVSRRTVRYYVQRELLPPPEGAGRGHFYRPSHLTTLLRIKELQGQGLGLEEIRARLRSGPDGERDEPIPTPVIEPATRIRIAEGVEILLSHGTKPPLPAQLRALADAAARILAKGD